MHTCLNCDRPVRSLTDPPVDTALSRAEWFAGRALYCLGCFEALDQDDA